MSQLHLLTPRPGAVGDVVFLHGLGGDAFGTWRHGSDEATSWPHWLAEEFPAAQVWSVGYAASPSKWPRWMPWTGRDAGYGMALLDRGRQLLDAFALEGIGERPLLLVGHSLGGLVIKQILRLAAESGDGRKARVRESTRAVMFLGTPHAGSALARIGEVFPATEPTVTLTDLQSNSATLHDLAVWYRQHAAWKTVVYFEQRPVKGAVLVVDRASSDPGVTGCEPIPLDEDHMSLVKPRTKQDQVYRAAARLLKEVVLLR